MKPCLAADITIGYCSRHVDVAQVTTCSSCISFQKRRKVGKSLVSSNVLLIIPHNEDNMQLYHGFLTVFYSLRKLMENCFKKGEKVSKSIWLLFLETA